ncbi:response regulator transcription factor [Ovoidimarina sediminis]|uniref:response regulator transcription factor n=1 Tax=Ovoidimarina sediminis TaxID=3079856 RepID=UPI00290DC1FB|nr:response regulator transcription factor [Rhodophyticola sp. MJ-SS7]MDU8945511.1 response regulator transcription factor [Rhodophyticola sp. MJ-SS7]
MPTVLIADDHELVRDTIATYIAASEGFTVNVASDFHEAVDALTEAPETDLVILDYEMPGMNGLEGLRKLRDLHGSVKVALMSGVTNDKTAARALQYGACAYLPKSLSVRTMLEGIRKAMSGGRFFPINISEDESAGASCLEWQLSPREYDVLELLSYGRSNRDIASALTLKEVTVKLHVTNILSKLGADNRTQAALMARERRLF